jgi:hypothetical protein
VSVRPLRTKNPLVAAILSLIFGPFGYFYISWRYGVAGTLFALLVMPIMGLILFLTGFLIPGLWGLWGLAPTIAIVWQGFRICQLYNIECNFLAEARRSGDLDVDEAIPSVDSFTVAALFMSNLFVKIVWLYCAAFGLHTSMKAFARGDLTTGFLSLLITPLFVFSNYLLAGLLAMGFERIVFLVWEKTSAKRL